MEKDPEALDRALVHISSLITGVEKEFHSPDTLKLKVRNLAYSEPPCGTNDALESFRPTPSIAIQPLSTCVPKDTAPDTVVLDPGHAFGNGKHPTTRLCLEILDSIAQGERGRDSFSRWSVLDFGCGTSLLAIAAVRLGARAAVGIEIDSESAAVAERNVRLNRLSDRIQIRKGSWETTAETFDLILANLVPSVLFRTGKEISNHLKKEGIVIVSGFGEKLLDEISNFFSEAGLLILERFSLKTWAALLMTHRSS
jgi:ribosomal protein L11 methyltransferase